MVHCRNRRRRLNQYQCGHYELITHSAFERFRREWKRRSWEPVYHPYGDDEWDAYYLRCRHCGKEYRANQRTWMSRHEDKHHVEYQTLKAEMNYQ